MILRAAHGAVSQECREIARGIEKVRFRGRFHLESAKSRQEVIAAPRPEEAP